MAESPRACAICEGGNRVCRHLLRCGTRSSENTRHSCPNRSNSCGLNVPSSALQKTKVQGTCHQLSHQMNFSSKTMWVQLKCCGRSWLLWLIYIHRSGFRSHFCNRQLKLESESDSMLCEKKPFGLQSESESESKLRSSSVSEALSKPCCNDY